MIRPRWCSVCVTTEELPDLEAEGGRGLFLVDSLSSDWGCIPFG